MLPRISHQTYIAACDHADQYPKCAHVSCGIIINNELVAVTTNSPSLHAEMEALVFLTKNSLLSEREKCKQ